MMTGQWLTMCVCVSVTTEDCVKNGQYVGTCCNGFCAANKCRPYVYPQDISE